MRDPLFTHSHFIWNTLKLVFAKKNYKKLQREQQLKYLSLLFGLKLQALCCFFYTQSLKTPCTPFYISNTNFSLILMEKLSTVVSLHLPQGLSIIPHQQNLNANTHSKDKL